MKLLLTSNGFYTDEIKKQFLQLINHDPMNKSAAIITTASPEKEKNRFAKKAQEDFRKMGFANIDCIDFEFDDPECLKQKDVIYISGGNPFHLLFHTRESGADRVFRELASQNIVIVGVSAGAILLGPDIQIVQFFTPRMNVRHTKDLSALALTDIRVFPHCDREDLFLDGTHKTIEERLKEYEIREGCRISRLKDDGYLITGTVK